MNDNVKYLRGACGRPCRNEARHRRSLAAMFAAGLLMAAAGYLAGAAATAACVF